jgi:hypothetical protein
LFQFRALCRPASVAGIGKLHRFNIDEVADLQKVTAFCVSGLAALVPVFICLARSACVRDPTSEFMTAIGFVSAAATISPRKFL